MFPIGVTAVISIVSHLFFIYISWHVLQVINIEPFIRQGRGREAKIFMIFVAIAIGTGVSSFFLDILQWSQDLNYLL